MTPTTAKRSVAGSDAGIELLPTPTSQSPSSRTNTDAHPAAPGPSHLLAYSNNQEAVASLRYWQEVARSVPFYKRKDKAQARANADAARERCLIAGVNWELVPKPPADFRAPDRSGRPMIGAARVAAPEAMGGPASGPAGGGTAAHSGRHGRSAALAGAGGGAAGGFVGGVAGAAAWQWVRSAQPVHSAADGSQIFQASDGGYWLTDPGGDVFMLAESGGWLAGDGDGMLWALSDTGQYVTWAPDGNLVSLAEDGTLTAVNDQGDVLTLGEDGAFYFSGADGDFYTMGADACFYGVDGNGDYFASPEGSGFSNSELAGVDSVDDGDGESFWGSL